ncbi:hypothetical protein HDU88_004669 [Geranomyces variabilis]|nr:hypothetical protein HDU88_004669 [Geranomyces variabilis]
MDSQNYNVLLNEFVLLSLDTESLGLLSRTCSTLRRVIADPQFKKDWVVVRLIQSRPDTRRPSLAHFVREYPADLTLQLPRAITTDDAAMHMLLIRELDLETFETHVAGVFLDNKDVCRWVTAAGTWKPKNIRTFKTFKEESRPRFRHVTNPWPEIVKTCLQRGHFDLLRGIWTKDLDAEVWGDFRNTWAKDVARGLRGDPSGLRLPLQQPLSAMLSSIWDVARPSLDSYNLQLLLEATAFVGDVASFQYLQSRGVTPRPVQRTSRLDILHRFVRDAQEAGVNLKSAGSILLRDLVYKHDWTGTGGDHKCEILKCLRSAGETLKDDPISFPKWLPRWKDPRDCAEATQAIESLLELGFNVEKISINYKEWCEQQGVPFALLVKYGSSWAIRFLQGKNHDGVLAKCDPRRWKERHCCVDWKSVVHCISLLK